MKQHNELLKGNSTKEMIPRRRKFSPVPLSFAQQRLFVLNRLVPSNPFYNVSFPFLIVENLDVNVLRKSIHEVIRRHEILRTIFIIENGTPVQKILPGLEFSLDFVDLQELPKNKQEEALQRLCKVQASEPFDLSTPPLLRCGLFRLSKKEHLFFLTIHHIIFDGWSSQLFQKEMLGIYAAFSTGKPSPFPEPALQYADFSLWQRDFLQGEVLEKQLRFWKKILGGELPALELPADHQRPPIQNYNGSIKTFMLTGKLSGELTQLSRRERCSLFMTLLTALNILLYRYSDQDDILIGAPIANRNRTEIEKIIGFFVNTLVFRTDLSGNPTFLQLLKQVQNTAAAAYDHQDLPFAKLVEELQPVRYMSHSPIFQVMLTMGTMGKDKLQPGVEGSVDTSAEKMMDNINFHQNSSIFDLLFIISFAENRLKGKVEYNTDIFEESTISRIINNFQNLLNGITANPNKCIDELTILSEEEKERLLVHWNNTKKEYHMQSLHIMFAGQVEKTPGQTALIFDNQYLTYEELNQRTGQWAGHLQKRGIRINEPVGICMERSLDMVIGILGILKAGGAYMPLDPELPTDRLIYIIKDANISFLLTQEKFKSKLADFPVTMISIDGNRDSTVKDDENVSPVEMSVKDAAYVIYTSGSTGRPKGVIILHEGICNRLKWMQDQYRLTPSDRILQKTPFGFDVSVWEFFWPLLFGAQLVMAKPGGHKDSSYLTGEIIKKGITIIHFVPSMLQVFLDDPGIKKIQSLRVVISSGEPLPVEYKQYFFSILNAELHNLYGPTEASVDVTYWRCKKDGDQHKVPIGHPISNTVIYLMDKNLNLVPIGVPGELHIGGVNLAQGYINQPELTINSFIANPFSKVRGARLYKTGDLARYLHDGSIEYIDRLDSQVKLRGFRIELGEIESNLRSYPGVQDAVAIIAGERGGSGSKSLVAYIVPDNEYWNLDNRGPKPDLAAVQISDWKEVFNDAYNKTPSINDPGFYINDWNRSYIGKPIPPAEMRQWLDDTVKRIRSLKPETVLEIGCGTGFILFEILPSCKYYLGTDISEKGLEYIRQNLGDYHEKVELLCCRADEFEGIDKGRFDIVVLNSVVQYFPSVDYLLRVIAGAINAVKPGGAIFIGDVRNLLLLKEFHASIEFHKADAATSRDKLNRQVMRSISREQELVIDPDFFIAIKEQFPTITYIERFIKPGPYNNELTKFRYDVLLHLDPRAHTLNEFQYINWRDHNLEIPAIAKLLEKEQSGLLRINGIINPLISRDIQIVSWLENRDNPLETLGQFQDSMEKLPGVGINPTDLLALSDKLPYDIGLVLSDSHGKGFYDVIFKHRDLSVQSLQKKIFSLASKDLKSQTLYNYANNPLLLKVTNELIPGLRNYLKEKLPGYMVPANFLLLKHLPLSPNGKLNRGALPEPFMMDYQQEDELIEPRTDIEKLLDKIWKDVLNLEKISINKNFFELGGDSIMAIRVISRINQAGFNLNLQDLYNNLNIAELAIAAEQKQTSPEEEKFPDLQVKIDRELIMKYLPPDAEIEEIYPALPMHKHMINYLKNHEVVDPPIFQFQTKHPFPDWNIPVLRQTLQKVAEISPQLRTVFLCKNLPEPVQVVLKKVKYDLNYVDLSDLNPSEQEKKIKEMMKHEWDLGFSNDGNHISIPMRLVIIKKGKGNFVRFSTTDYFRLAAWSLSQIIGNLAQIYMGLLKGEEFHFQPNDYYKKYLARIKNQDVEKAKIYWESVFKGYTDPKPFIEKLTGNRPGEGTGMGGFNNDLSFETTSQLDIFLQGNRIILSTLIQGLWAILISCYTYEEKVLFGFITGARANVFAGIEEALGYTINHLPVLIKIKPQESLVDWLKELWENHIVWGRYEHTQIEDVFNWCGMPDKQPIYETMVVVQNVNFTKDARRSRRVSDRIKISGTSDISMKMECPLRLDVYPGDNIKLYFNYYRRFLTESSIIKIAEKLNTLIEAIIANPNHTVGELMNLVKTAENQLMMI